LPGSARLLLPDNPVTPVRPSWEPGTVPVAESGAQRGAGGIDKVHMQRRSDRLGVAAEVTCPGA